MKWARLNSSIIRIFFFLNYLMNSILRIFWRTSGMVISKGAESVSPDGRKFM
jgi:hypothetical protein